jgi:hypothetical protein
MCYNDSIRVPLSEYFWSRVDQSGGLLACWEWVGAISTEGYGACNNRENCQRAHRVSWELHHGPIPAGMSVLHSCDNRLCVNPHHLHLGTHRDNMDEVVKRGRRAQYSADTVEAIREAHSGGMSYAVLTLRFGVSRATIWKIVHNRGRFASV